MAKVVALRQPRCCQPAIGSVHLDAFALMTRYGNATPQFYILNSSLSRPVGMRLSTRMLSIQIRSYIEFIKPRKQNFI